MVQKTYNECVAMNLLLADGYDIPELALIFETRTETVRRHVSGDCVHTPPETADIEQVTVTELLDREGIRHRELSDLIGVKRATVVGWDRHGVTPSETPQRRVRTLFGVEIVPREE